MRPTLFDYLAGCVAGGVLVLGCNHERPRPAVYTAPHAVTVVPAPPPTPAAVAPVKPIETVAVKPEAPAVQPVQFKMGEQEVGRRSFADITAKPCYAHDTDYRKLSGELQFVHIRNAWRLRYASVDEEDRYGGSVTLTGMTSMEGFADGHFVRVEGGLVNPDSSEPSPQFRVQSIQRLPQP